MLLASFLLRLDILNSLFGSPDLTLKLQLDPLASIEHLLYGNVAKRESDKGDWDGAKAD